MAEKRMTIGEGEPSAISLGTVDSERSEFKTGRYVGESRRLHTYQNHSH